MRVIQSLKSLQASLKEILNLDDPSKDRQRGSSNHRVNFMGEFFSEAFSNSMTQQFLKNVLSGAAEKKQHRRFMIRWGELAKGEKGPMLNIMEDLEEGQEGGRIPPPNPKSDFLPT